MESYYVGKYIHSTYSHSMKNNSPNKCEEIIMDDHDNYVFYVVLGTLTEKYYPEIFSAISMSFKIIFNNVNESISRYDIEN